MLSMHILMKYYYKSSLNCLLLQIDDQVFLFMFFWILTYSIIFLNVLRIIKNHNFK
jgi:hypothetical protein